MEYPAQYESQCSLDDGTRVYLRPIKADDIGHMAKMFEKFSPESIYFRFFSAMRAMPIDRLKEFCDIDYDNQMAVVAYVIEDGDESLLGVARYVVTPEEGGAEISVIVADAWQKRTIGTRLLQHLVRVAKDRGIDKFHGLIMSHNRKALGMLRNSGFEHQESAAGYDTRHIEFNLSDVDLPPDVESEGSGTS